MISFLLGILVLLVVLWAVHLVINALTLPETIKQIAYVIVALVALFWLLGIFGVVGMPVAGVWPCGH